MVISYDCSNNSNYVLFRFLVRNKLTARHFAGTYSDFGFMGPFVQQAWPIKGNIPKYLYYIG